MGDQQPISIHDTLAVAWELPWGVSSSPFEETAYELAAFLGFDRPTGPTSPNHGQATEVLKALAMAARDRAGRGFDERCTTASYFTFVLDGVFDPIATQQQTAGEV